MASIWWLFWQLQVVCITPLTGRTKAGYKFKPKGMMTINMLSPGAQLTLPVEPLENITFEQIGGKGSKKTVAILSTFLKAASDNFLFVTGVKSSGKSHLLQASCQFKMQMGDMALYLSCDDCLVQGGFDIFTPVMLDGLDHFDLICIDDLSLLLRSPDMEEALFHLFNRVRDTGRQLIVSDALAPSGLAIELPDLLSRLQSGLVLKLPVLTDEEKKMLLIKKALDRGFQLEPEVVQYLMKRSDRSIKVLMETLKKLDRASLSHQRKLTIPFVKEVLGL